MKKQQIIVVPLYMGVFLDNNKEWQTANANTVIKYIKRALLFFGTRNNISVFYPEGRERAADSYIHDLDVDRILLGMKRVKMEKYTLADDTRAYIDNPEPLIRQFSEILLQDEAQDARHAIYFISMCHVYHFITAYRNVIGLVDMSFRKPGEIGSTEVFYFKNDEENSVEHLCFHNHLDFFIPERIDDFSEQIMKLGATVHAMSKRLGHTNFLQQLSTFC